MERRGEEIAYIFSVACLICPLIVKAAFEAWYFKECTSAKRTLRVVGIVASVLAINFVVSLLINNLR